MCEELRSLISENENILDIKFIDKKIKSMIEYLVPESDSLEESYEIVLNYYKKNKLTKEYKMNKQIEMLIKRIDSLEKENKILKELKADPIFYINDNLKEPINYYDKNYMIFSDLNMKMINMIVCVHMYNSKNPHISITKLTNIYDSFIDKDIDRLVDYNCVHKLLYFKDTFIYIPFGIGLGGSGGGILKYSSGLTYKYDIDSNSLYIEKTKKRLFNKIKKIDLNRFESTNSPGYTKGNKIPDKIKDSSNSIYKNNTIIDTTKPFMTKDFMNLTIKILVFMNCENNLNLEFLPETVERVVFITCEIDNFDNMKFGIPDITIIGCDIGNINRLKDFSNEIKVKIDNLGVSTKIEDFDKSCFPANVEII